MLILMAGFLQPHPAWAAEQSQENAPRGPSIEIMDVAIRFDSQKRFNTNEPICMLAAQNMNQEEFIRHLWSDYASAFGSRDWNNFGPDSGYREIRLSYSGKTIVLRSWHPSAERNNNVVATTNGIEPLNGRTRDQALAGNPDYLSKRRAFDSIVMECLARQHMPPASAGSHTISKERAIDVARRATSMKIPADAPTDVIISDDDYIVTLKTNPSAGILSSDYYAKVWVNRHTSKVSKSLVGI